MVVTMIWLHEGDYGRAGVYPDRRIFLSTVQRPRVHRPLGGNANQQHGNKVQFNAAKNIFLSEANVQ